VLGDSVRRRQPQRRRRAARSAADRRRWRPLLLALPFAVIVPFLIGYLVAVLVVFPPLPEALDGIPVPDLAGRTAADAQRALADIGLGPIEATELPHPTAAAGVVVAQSPLPGQQLRAGAGVTVALSTGRPRAVVPDVAGFGADRAETMLRRAGFDVVRMLEEGPLAPDRVIRTEPAAAHVLPLPAAITLVVSTGPPPVEPDTLFDVPPPVPDDG
jgi:eukaryotic-like serine/threonine-protein kinase